MIFNCIVKNEEKAGGYCIKFLKHACKKRKIEFNMFRADLFDFSRKYNLTENDLLFKKSAGSKSTMIEKMLLNNRCASFYISNNNFVRSNKIKSYSILKKAGLPVIKSIFDVTDDKTLLKKYVRSLGGFPIILKAGGKQDGKGIIKMDSWESLYSLLGYLIDSGLQDSISMKKFIPHKIQARLVVVGDKVVDSKANIFNNNDFRLNNDQSYKQKPMIFSKKIQEIAIEATHLMNSEFGGVDILLDKNKKPHIAEINIPTDFSATRTVSKNDVALCMVDHLIQKAKNK